VMRREQRLFRYVLAGDPLPDGENIYHR
jgi:hypothetical protein